MGAIVEVTELVKDYRQLRAVDHLTFAVEEGQVYGLLGPNGSGKSTTLKILLGLIRATRGSVRVFHLEDPEVYRSQIGVLLESFSFYPYLTGYELLKLFSEIKGVPLQRGLSLAEEMGIAPHLHRKYKTYSLGMKQRIAFAIAMLKDVPLYIFDEPTNGMDAFGIVEVRNWIQKLQQQGKTILVCSHLLAEMEKVCTHVGLLSQGKLVYNGPLSELMNQYGALETAFLTLVQTQERHGI
jgi:ABC-2 type transport system ATP-binding protein